MFLLWYLLNPPAAWLSNHHIMWTQTAKFIFLSCMSGLMYVNCARFPLCLYMTKLKHETLLSFLYMYMKCFVRTLTGWAPTKIERRSNDVTKFNL